MLERINIALKVIGIIMDWAKKAQEKDSSGGKEITYIEVAELARIIGQEMMEQVEPRYFLSVDIKPKQNDD